MAERGSSTWYLRLADGLAILEPHFPVYWRALRTTIGLEQENGAKS